MDKRINAKIKTGGAVRLSLPVKVAYNADAFKKSIYNLLDELGCRACFSGVDCYFTTERDFRVNPQTLELSQPEIGRTALNSNILAFNAEANKTLSVSVSPKTSFDIDRIDSAIKNIFEEIGCLACCSGHDIYFQNQFDFNF